MNLTFIALKSNTDSFLRETYKIRAVHHFWEGKTRQDRRFKRNKHSSYLARRPVIYTKNAKMSGDNLSHRGFKRRRGSFKGPQQRCKNCRCVTRGFKSRRVPSTITVQSSVQMRLPPIPSIHFRTRLGQHVVQCYFQISKMVGEERGVIESPVVPHCYDRKLQIRDLN